MKNNLPRKNLNVDKENLLPLWTLKEHDDVVLKLALFKNSVAFDITGQTVRLGAKTSVGLKEQNDGFTIDKNNLDIVLKNSILSQGVVELDLQLIDANGQMTTASFFILVGTKVLNDSAVEATNEFNTFKKTVDQIEGDYKNLKTIMLDENNAANLQVQVNKVNESLEQNKKETSDSDLRKVSKGKSCVSIIFDDCAYYDYQYLLPIVKEKNIKIGLACLTDWVGTYNANTQFMTWEQIREFSDLGNEIISHSIKQDIKYDILSDLELEHYFKESRDTLRERGYWSDLIAYTWGTSDARIRKVARKYYKAGFAIWGQEIVQNSNGSTLKTYDIARVGLNGEDRMQGLFPSNTDSLEYLKARVDYAKANNQWLVFMGHSFMFKDTSKTKIQQFKDLIDYVKSVGMDIVIPSEGLQRMGNQIDLVSNEDETKYFTINSKGQIRSNINDVWENDTFNGTSKLTEFRRGITVTSISTAKAQTDANIPVNIGGTLVTYRPFLDDLGYEDYIAGNGLRFTRWAIDSKGNMSDWLNLLPPTKYNNQNIVIPSITVPANSTYNYTFKLTGIAQENDIALYPIANIETGLIFMHWVMPDGTIVIRFANITGNQIVTTERTWVANTIKLR